MLNHFNGIYTVDANYYRPIMSAVHLVVEGDQVAIIETAHAKSLPMVEDALRELNLSKEQVKYIVLSHIHLDHAGGAGLYMQNFPNAQLVVHPKGARHMVDPSVLEASVTTVYGSEFVREMYGELIPVAAERILVAEDGLTLDLNGRSLLCRHTPGHANHHLIVVDAKTRGIFSGDVFGVAYWELDVDETAFIFPTTTPVNFDPQKMCNSIDLIVSYHPHAVYLTHYGQVQHVEQLASRLKKMIAAYVAIAEECVSSSDPVAAIEERLISYMLHEARLFGVALSDASILAVIGMDLKINAQGLAIWLSSLARAHG